MIKNSSYVPTPQSNNDEQKENNQDVRMEQDPTYLSKQNNQGQ